jgi:diguanylate cyclase (GGDEF)-like protein
MFHYSLAQEEQRARRYTRPLAMLMLDIDHFKLVNDRYGHLAGDDVLRELSQRIEGETRSVDSVYRYGGEEIAILLPETHSAEARELAERVRRAIERHPFAVARGQTTQVTISIGVAVFPDHADSPDALVAAADQALYLAKESGRNQVCVYADS